MVQNFHVHRLGNYLAQVHIFSMLEFFITNVNLIVEWALFLYVGPMGGFLVQVHIFSSF